MRKIPIGIENFRELIKDNYFYVDKTKFIEEIFNDGAKVKLFTRPRRFGKTLNMSMLKYFFDIREKEENRKLFEGLYIENSSIIKEQGKYPVIFISMKQIQGNNFKELENRLKIYISNIFEDFSYLREGLTERNLKIFDKIWYREEAEYIDSLSFLIKILKEHFNQEVIFLVDEYDVPLMSAYECGYYNEAVKFFKLFYGAVLKGNSNLKMGVLTGAIRVAQAGIFSDLNNLKVNTILNKAYDEYFGLTEAEVEIALKEYGIEYKIEDVKSWYDGYQFGSAEVYNPWSILNYIDNKELKPYWINTSGNILIKNLLLLSDGTVFESLNDLVNNQEKTVYINESIALGNNLDPDSLWELMLFSGYLTVKEKINNEAYLVRIPNKEIQSFFKSLFAEIVFNGKTNISSMKEAFKNDNLCYTVDINNRHWEEQGDDKMNYKKENGWNCIESREQVFDFSEGYKQFLDSAKTEREFVTKGIILAESKGFVNAENKTTLTAGDKIYYVNRGKNLVLAVIGKEDIEKGINYVVSHIDSPRLDLKGNPLYEDLDLAYMKTHYYGGIKKYQWASIPLAMHGVVVLASGKKIEIEIGEKESDPVFTIPDILPHLAGKIQGDRKTGEVIKGEELQIIVGSIPSTIEDKDVKEKIKYTVLEILNRDYGMIEEDFISAELELVPAGKARDLGFDRSMIGAYGQDDRICGYTSMMAVFDLEEVPEKTAVCFLADKEEIGSSGATGLKSDYLNYITGDMIAKIKGNYNEMMLRKTLWNSNAMSSDVNAGIDPIFRSVHDAQNAAKIGYGVVVTKYTGARGKSSTNDADAEYVGKIRKMLNDAKVNWQIGELGKVDEGGGGTVAMFLAELGINTIDIGPALLAMHSPFEVSSKLDVYETYRAYKVFFKN